MVEIDLIILYDKSGPICIYEPYESKDNSVHNNEGKFITVNFDNKGIGHINEITESTR